MSTGNRDPKDYVIGPDSTISDIDLEQEEFTAPDGTRLTEEKAEQLAAEHLADKRRANLIPGRKSLAGDGSHSPIVQFRSPRKDEGQALAEQLGVSLSELARSAFERELDTPRLDVAENTVRAGDTITLEHPNGDRIGPRSVSMERGPGGARWLNVDRVGDVDPKHGDARFARPLERLLASGWRVTSIARHDAS